jgi:glycosyltransferase involved in cell wall biosynthesis
MHTTTLPTFSVVIETENLATADVDGLAASLDSLTRQTVGLERAQEVWIVDSGDVSAEHLAALRVRFPWLRLFRVPEGLDYYDAKMRAALACSGEICVFCDSDCKYDADWLESLLRVFANDPQAAAVGGETRVKAEGVYGLANALVYLFPPFTGTRSPRTSRFYFFNNVAFRLALLRTYPLPSNVPLYRGHCYLHAQGLLRAGHDILIQPAARASHAPPNGVSHFFWRYLLIGSDEITIRRLLADGDTPTTAIPKFRPVRDTRYLFAGMYLRAKAPLRRVWPILAENPGRTLLLPFAAPIVGAAMAAYVAGLVITFWRPGFSLEARRKWEGSIPAEAHG